MTIETLDRPPPGWFVLDVMRSESGKRDWVALMVDVAPDDLKNCSPDYPARFFLHPVDYRPGRRTVRQCWVRIAGEHSSQDAAREALEKMLQARPAAPVGRSAADEG